MKPYDPKELAEAPYRGTTSEKIFRAEYGCRFANHPVVSEASKLVEEWIARIGRACAVVEAAGGRANLQMVGDEHLLIVTGPADRLKELQELATRELTR